MAEEQWLSFDDATEIVRVRLNASVGAAQKALRTALVEGDVRLWTINDPPPAGMAVLLTADDGVVGMPWRHALAPAERWLSKDDLLYWLDQQAPPQPMPVEQTRRHRYAGDVLLIEKGRELVAGGMSKSKAAKQLAPQASGGSIDQRAERLRKLF